MVQGLAFLSKKSWHTKNLANQEKVWIAEERKKNEERKTHELARQIQAEREQEELDKITNQTGQQQRLDRGIDWMYSGQNPQSEVAQRDAEKQAEEYLLGKEFTGGHGSRSRPTGDLAQADQDNEGFLKVLAGQAEQNTATTTAATNESTGFLAEPSVAERNEAFRLRHEDPMFAVSMAAAEKKRASERNKELFERVTGAVAVEPRRNDDEEKIGRSKEKKSHKEKKKKSKKKHSEKRHHRPDHDYESATSDNDSYDRYRKKRDHSYREGDKSSHRDDRRHRHYNQSDRDRKRQRRSESPRDDRNRKKYDDDGPYRYREDIRSSQNVRKQENDYEAHGERKPTNDYHRKERHNVNAKAEREGERSFSRKSSQSRGDFSDRSMNSASGRKHPDDYDSDRGCHSYHSQDDRKQPAQDSSRRQNSPSPPHRSITQRHHDDNRHDHDPKYISCKLDPPTNELKKPPGYGLQGQMINSMEPSHSDNMPLGPHQDLLRRKRKEKEEERRRLRESASIRRPLTAKERDDALRQMKYNANLREQDIANRQRRPLDDDEGGMRSRSTGDFYAPASFLQEVAQETHGVHGDTISMAQRISQNRNKQQRWSQDAFL